jgi:FkbM family methyltransferase
MLPVPQTVARIPILRGIYRVVLSGYARLTRGRYLVEERMGLRLLLDPVNVVDRQIFIGGTWEKELVDTLFGLVKEQRRLHDREAVFLDLGAHWGLYALLAHKSGLFRRIVAYEPDPTNYAQLQANLFLNHAENVIEARKLAVSDREETFGLYMRTQANRGATQLVKQMPDGRPTCRSVRVDSDIELAGKLVVAKIDVEGHEMEVLDGMAGLLAKNRCIVQLEIWSTPEEEMEVRLARIEKLFAQYGIKRVRSIIADHFFVSEPDART